MIAIIESDIAVLFKVERNGMFIVYENIICGILLEYS
jgi:hypothetical protein